MVARRRLVLSGEVVHLDVFARGPGGGNPCPVIVDATGLSDARMQGIAAHYGHETCFVLPGPDLRLRFFVPRHEMAMCVHATVAAVTVLVGTGALSGSEVLVHTASGPCRVSWDDATPPNVSVEQQTPEFGPTVAVGRQLEHVLRLHPGAVDDRYPIRAVSVSRAKLIVRLRTAADVQAADPRLDELWQLCRELDATGVYLFAPHPDGRVDHLVARQFPVDAGYPEDPATGVAAGALAAYLADGSRPAGPSWLDITIDQGDAMGRPSRLGARAFADATGVHRTVVIGQAAVAAQEALPVGSAAGRER
jgi:PhzF family phenazine biosynthesis protein